MTSITNDISTAVVVNDDNTQRRIQAGLLHKAGITANVFDSARTALLAGMKPAVFPLIWGQWLSALKEAAGNVTARMLQKTASDMETAGKSGDMASLQRLLPELKQQFLQMKRTINRHGKKLPT